MTVRFGLDRRCALIADGTSKIGGACVKRLRDEGMAVAFAGGGTASAVRRSRGRGG